MRQLSNASCGVSAQPEANLVPGGHGIGLLRPEVARRIQGAVGDHHLQREPPPAMGE